MCRRCMGLVSLVLVLTVGTSIQAARFSDNFDMPFNYLTDGLGAYSGLLSEGVSSLNASITHPGVLYFESAGGVWDPGPGPLLYVEVHGDFGATVKVANYAGTAAAYVYYNNCGLMARALPADGGDGEDWIAIDYFPLYNAGNIVRYADDGVRYEDVGGNGTAFNADVYLQLERKGNTFYLRTSPDGENWVDYPAPNFSPLERPDLDGVPMQVGLAQCTYTENVGYVAFDDFSVVPPGPKVVYVTDSFDLDADGAFDDQGWIDWLVSEGYQVDARRDYWQVLDVNKIAELNAADVVIMSRGVNTGNYNQTGEADQWNGLAVPMLNINLWMSRANRLKWMNNPSDVKKDGGSPLMRVSDPNHPLFAGLPVDPNGLLDVLDPNVGSGNTSFYDSVFGVGNGTELATSQGIYTSSWVVEWQPGVEYYDGCGQCTGGRRGLFSAGTQDVTLEDGSKTPQGMLNLNENGKQLVRNIIAYLLRPKEVPIENFSFELPGTEKIKGWNGEGVSGTPAVDIPGWASDSAVADSGVETGYTATDGEWTAFLMGSDPSVWQLTDYVIDAEDVFELQVDARSTGSATTLRIILFYDDEGFRMPAAFADVAITDAMQTFSLVFNAADMPEAVGKKIGVEFDNVTTNGDSWLGLDNVRLYDLEGR